MTTITHDDIVKLAMLSNLTLSDAEVADLQGDITNILSYVEQLDDLDTTGVEPAYQVTGLSNITRADQVEVSEVTRQDLLELAPESKDYQIKVPKVL